MGSGKSTAANILSKSYHVFDLDSIIENYYKMSVFEIFKEKGENIFRKIERDLFNYLIQYDNLIISSGGGTLIYCDDKNLLLNNCNIIFLYSPLKTLWQRVKNSKRPLALNFDKFEELYFKRLMIYLRYCNLIIDSNSENWIYNIERYIKIVNFKQIKSNNYFEKILRNYYLKEIKKYNQ